MTILPIKRIGSMRFIQPLPMSTAAPVSASTATAICSCARSRSDLSRFADDHPEVDGVSHGCIASPVGVNLFAGPTGCGIRLELGAQLAGPRVAHDGVEVDHAIEDAGRADEAVELLSLRVDFGRAVRRHAAVERADDRGH